MNDADTICACATAWGHAALAVVRVSGPEARAAAERVAGRCGAPRVASYRRFRDRDGTFDDGVVTWFPGPRSYTGEDVVELSGHGNPLLVERLLRALGVRLARPGEFTRRAFLNGRLDLTRAEAVIATIEATSRRGLDLARAGMDGRVAEEVASLRAALTDLAAELEAILDYPGEDLLFEADGTIAGRMRAQAARAAAAAGSVRAGRVAVEGARVVLSGPVNAGKSSLFNALLGRERAIVSAAPGTTRDAVEAPLQLESMRIVLVDTAGERETEDVVEATGVAHAAAERAAADLVLRCVPPGAEAPGQEAGALVVRTMADVSPPNVVETSGVAVSSRTGAGLPELRAAIVAALGGETPGNSSLILTSARQAASFAQVAVQVEEAASALGTAGPAVSVELLYAALESLSEVDGSAVREAVLDRLFARFCVGK
ncbi:tRNA modification GTPase MnmE [Deltaproteobacteria bacterium]|nr:tRNA modification GTPase MnmE [Deltaproteobacteria bacterium]